MEVCYRRWLEWVRVTYPREYEVVNRKVIGIKPERAAMLTPHSIREHFSALTACLERCGILDKDGKIAHGHRLWAADEKGMCDTEGKLKFVSGLAIKKLGAPTCSAGGSGFKHISVLPFISLDGKISEPYITMAGSSTMNVWKEVWPQAHVAVSEKGAVTTDLFSQFYAHWCQYVRDVLKIPLSESIVVILDSGGGSLSHLSVSVGVLSEKYNIAPFYLPPHHTCAVMPLDMHPNRAFESHWAHIRSRSTSISSLQALDSLQIGCAPDPDKILIDKPELFKKIVPVADRDYKEAQNANALPQPRGYERALASHPCTSCKRKVPTSAKFCSMCGATNANYDAIQGSVSQGAKSQAYKRKPTQITDMQNALDFSPSRKKSATKVWGDLTAKAKAIQPELSEVPETEKKKEPESEKKKEPTAAEEREFDLECVDDCLELIAHHWQQKEPENLRVVVSYFLADLHQKATKSMPLSHLVNTQVLQSGVLKTKTSRQAWLDAWAKNRSHRFVQLPAYLQKK
ncbi:Uncharacterized protein SCF082_LOCUS34013 [Durusdinium trenchii]